MIAFPSASYTADTITPPPAPTGPATGAGRRATGAPPASYACAETPFECRYHISGFGYLGIGEGGEIFDARHTACTVAQGGDLFYTQ